MTEEPALLKAIFAAPAEDTPRLAYAEWLMENASDRPGRSAQQMLDLSEFIFLQINLSRGVGCHPVSGAGIDLSENPELKAKLLAREQALLPTMIDLLNLGPDINHIIAGEPKRISFSRGFLHNLYLYGTPPTQLLTQLPEDLHVGGNLNLARTRVSQLPQALHVGGTLNLFGIPITQLPEDLHVGGNLNLYGTRINPEAARRILDMPGLSDQAKISGLRTAGFENLAEQAERNASGRHEGRG